MEEKNIAIMREEYIKTNAGFRLLAQKYGVTYYFVQSKAKKEGWIASRIEYRKVSRAPSSGRAGKMKEEERQEMPAAISGSTGKGRRRQCYFYANSEKD